MENARTFTDRLSGLLASEHAALGEFLLALADFDRHGLWVELGYSSLFDFLHRELRLSKGAAFYRKTAVDLVERFPEIVEPLRDGRLCLMTVAEVARVLTPEDQQDVLPRFFHLSKREAQALAAELQPHPAPPERELITPVRATTVAPALASSPTPTAAVGEGSLVQPVEPNAVAPAMEEILEAGLDLLLQRHAKRKGLVKKPRPEPRPSTDPDYVPAHVRRAVWKRDGGKCQFRLANGEICGSTLRVEIDHVNPRALGGRSTVENCRLACRAHNDRAARRVFGDPWMDRFTRNPRARPAGDGRSGGAPAPGRSPTGPLRVREEPAPYAASRRCRGRMASVSWRPPRTIPSSISGG